MSDMSGTMRKTRRDVSHTLLREGSNTEGVKTLAEKKKDRHVRPMVVAGKMDGVSVNIKIPRAWRDAIEKIGSVNERSIAQEIRLCIKKAYGFKRG